MKLIRQNPTLAVAIAVSVLVHGALLAVRFAAPDSFKFKPSDPGLEVILVNAKHDRKPVKAEALAQANLDGGGKDAEGRARSFLADTGKHQNGESLKAMQRRIEELDRQQQQLLAQLNKKSKHTVAQTKNLKSKDAQQPKQNGKDEVDSESEIHRTAAELAKDIQDYNKRPQKSFLSPSTLEAGHAMYYKMLQERVEKYGTLNFPQKNGKKLYGELVLSIPIFQDGSIYKKDGGIRIEKSSNNDALDAAAIRIVERSAPFGKFPQNMRTIGRDDVWIVVTKFKFTREGGIEANLRGGGG